MKTNYLAPDSCIFEFDELTDYKTYVASIYRNHTIYLIDTFLGPEAMHQIMRYLEKHFSYQQVVVINTHYHFDHIWGNCYFENSTIIAHHQCKENIKNLFWQEAQSNYAYRLGDVSMQLPTFTFESSLSLEDDLTAFYSPGHTDDSISIYDAKTKILYVGDNLERPLLHTESKDLNAYLNTLKYYQKLPINTITAGHTLSLTKDDLQQSIAYLESLISHTNFPLDTTQKKIHQENIDFLKSKQHL